MPQLNAEPQGVETYFTDVEQLQQVFKNAIAAHTLAKRLLIIHGIGGVGKSSLLQMFRLHCKNVAHVPVALSSGGDAKSAVDVLKDWADDLKAAGVTMPSFSKTFEHYRAVQAKAENRVGKFTEKVAKITVKTIIETTASTVPGIGQILHKLGGIGADALIDWLRSQGFSKIDIDLLLDPARKMTDDFLADIAKPALTKRHVLMLDTYEQMTALGDWTCNLAQRLHPNVLLVIAGREMVNWDRQWQGWLSQADVQPLEAMTSEMMRDLVRNYYRTQLGGDPDLAQVEKIIRFSRGLPMAVTTAVRLWVKYRVKEFGEVEAGALDEIVRLLREGVPPQIIPILEAAAVVRYFNKEILRAVAMQADVNMAYDEMRSFPFVKSGKVGTQPVHRLHDSVREFIDRSLQVDDPERFRELHERATVYFEKRLEKTTGEETEQLGLERLYHRIRADEEVGIKLFQELAEEMVRYRLINPLRVLMNDANTYPLECQNSKLWREYYIARLAHLQARWPDAMTVYERIGQAMQADSKLKSYALCDWSEVLQYKELREQPGILEHSIHASESSLIIAGTLDNKLVLNYKTQSDVYMSIGNWDKAFSLLEIVIDFYHKQGDKYSEASAWGFVKTLCAVRGDWQRMYYALRKGLEILPEQYRRSTLYAGLIASWSPAYVYSGRFIEAEKKTREGLALARDMGEVDVLGYLRDLGIALAVQGKYQEAHVYFQECENLSVALGRPDVERSTSLRFKAVAWLKEGKLDLASTALATTIAIVEKGKYVPALGEALAWSGLASEVSQKFEIASNQYRRSLDFRGRRYLECGALTGLARVKHAQGDYAAIPPLLAEAEQLAQQYEYNDHLASLRLIQGIATEKTETNGQSTMLNCFKHAMIYALRYNRFLLDEVLSGRPQGTPLRPIIPYCLDRGEEGRKILIVLRDWWKTGINDIGTPRPDTISPIPEGIALLEAERISREREPGNGSLQKTVIEQIEMALK